MKQRASYRLATTDLLRTLVPASPLRSALAVAGDWLLILGAAAFSSAFASSWAAYIVACLIIASRQHALLVLMHEGAHGHLVPNAKWNDRLTNIFTSWPFGISMERYRQHHWKHHQFTNTEQDPDWGRKVAHPHWQFPKTPIKFWKDFLPYLWGLGIRELTFAVYGLGARPWSSPGAYVFYGILFSAVTFINGWEQVMKFWLVPYLTLLPILMKIRSIVEHLGLPNKTELTASRNIIGSPVEAFFFGPHGNSLHLIHHLFPQVPWFNLPTMRTALRLDKDFRENAHENFGYFLPFAHSALSDLTKRTEAERDAHRQNRSAA